MTEGKTDVPAQVEDPGDPIRDLVAHAELLEIRLVSVQAKLNPDCVVDGAEFELKVAPLQFRGGFDEEASLLVCGVKFQVGAAVDQADDDLIKVCAEYDLVYSVPPFVHVGTEGIEAFSGRNAPYNAWPFFRELTHSIVGRMGMPPLVLPLVRPPLTQDMPRAGAEESEEEAEP